ncbi:protein bark beetle, partial [Trichonephila inaurata madagascariensis]
MRLKEPIENKVSRRYSLSILDDVIILHAGRDEYGNAVPALDILGQPPIMNGVTLKYSAFDGIHLYKPEDSFIIENSVVADNRGHGIFINSSVSQVTLSEMKIRGNGGDGVHFRTTVIFPPAFVYWLWEEQIYPVRRSHVQRREQRYVQACEQVFEVASWTGQVLTVNFMGFSSDISDPNHASRIDVYDGPTDSSRLLASVPIVNNTFPESVTSTRQKILLKYRPRIHYDASFVVEIVANQ